jgi:hypothetical protein
MSERDKYLTEAMGECWHESDWGQTICKHCRRTNDPRYFDFDEQNKTFSSWSGFGKLWNWSQKQEWWMEFKNWYICRNKVTFEYLIHPDRFADAVYEFLKEMEG